jgi:hypothetical protein
MGEIVYPELIIILFLLLALLRPFVKGLWAMDGLVWLPVLSLLLAAGLFPAYGFRPECIPLLIYTLIVNIATIPQVRESAGPDTKEKRYEPKRALSAAGIIVLCAVTVPVFIFSPKIPQGLLSEGVQTRIIHNESAHHTYFLRIYSPLTENGRPGPLVFLAPPEAGSVHTVDRICAGLRDQGFMVIAYSRRGLDFPAAREGRKYYPSPARINAMWQAFRNGTESNKANTRGKFLESERQKDIEFLLPLVCRNRDEKDAALIPGLRSRGAGLPVFIAAYGAAGSAAVYLFEQPGFAARYANVQGIASIESRFWSSYQAAAPRDMKAQWLPQPAIPVLYMVSDRAVASPQTVRTSSRKARPNHYRAILDTFKNTATPAALAAFAGAGPFAYCDYPLTHPVYPFLFPGQMKNAAKSNAPIDDTAGYIGNFFIMLLTQPDLLEELPTQPDDSPAYNPLIMPERRPVFSNTLLERHDLPAF